MTKRLYSESKIHNRQVLTAINKIDSDSDSDYEQERVSNFLRKVG